MSDADLEQRLAALRPAALPAALQARLATPPVPPGRVRWLWAATVPLAAAAVFLLMPAVQRPGTLPAPAAHAPQQSAHVPQPSDYHVYLPISQTSTLVGVEDLAVIDTVPAHPIRLVRATWLDNVTYAGDDGHSTIHHRAPRAQIIPITLQAD